MRPPPMSPSHPEYAGILAQFEGRAAVPDTESLADTVQRTRPFWRECVEPQLRAGNTVLVLYPT